VIFGHEFDLSVEGNALLDCFPPFLGPFTPPAHTACVVQVPVVRTPGTLALQFVLAPDTKSFVCTVFETLD
jgi:hypothetical protein